MTTPESNDEISLLDILIVLAENFWLLLLAPLAIGAIAFGVVSFLPKTYESTAILFADAVTVGHMPGGMPAITAKLQSSEVLHRASGSQKWIIDMNLDSRSLNSLLSESVNVRSDRQSNLITLTASGPTPNDAESFAESILQAGAEAMSAQGAVKERMLQRLESARDALNVINPAIASILQVNPKTGKVETDLLNQPASRPALAQLMAQKLATEKTVRELEMAIAPSADDLVIQRPTLEEKPVRPKRLQLTAIATILSGLALTVFVFIRAAAQDPESSAKITRIRKGVLRH